MRENGRRCVLGRCMRQIWPTLQDQSSRLEWAKMDEPKDPEEMLRPSDLMPARHPDLFSDTTVEEVERLPKPVFEYHLDSLSSRKRECEFEYFCRKLAEKEICLNLRPQAGPAGGGDSKVDTETYPDAEEMALRWRSDSPAAGAERWAFAFSAKKAWKAKAVSDLKTYCRPVATMLSSIFSATNLYEIRIERRLRINCRKTALFP